MANKILFVTLCLLVLAWIVGLYTSHVRTKSAVREFYRWVHGNDSLPYDSFSIDVTETASELVKRFEQSDLPFKKYVRIGNGTLPHSDPPRPGFVLSLGGASNGSDFSTYVSMISTHYYASIRTTKGPDEKANGRVVVSVESYLFGIP